MVCFDYGTGTGFIPLISGKNLKKDDKFICGDISVEMLKECENNIKTKSFLCNFSFIKINGIDMPLENNSVDIITANSVLHHIINLRDFAKECFRVLKPGGFLIVNHEPHRHKNTGKPKNLFIYLAQSSALFEYIARIILSRLSLKYRLRNKMLSDIAKELKKEGLIDFTLRGTEIQQLVDFQTQFGFTKEEITREYFSQFQVVQFETYNNNTEVRFVLSS